MLPEDFVVVATVNAASPTVCAGIATKASTGSPAVTAKLVVAVVALYVVVAAWLACNTTVPTPVSVTVLPLTVAGPLATEYVTAPVEADVAETANAAVP